MSNNLVINAIDEPNALISALPERLTISGPSLFDGKGQLIPHLRGWNWGNWDAVIPADAFTHPSEGANIVRIVLRWKGLYGNPGIDSYMDGVPGYIDPANLALFDQMIAALSAAGLWINLAVDSNCGQNGAQDSATSAYCTIDGLPAQNFINNLGFRAKYKELWTFLLNRYRFVPRIAWCEIMPEPSGTSYTNATTKAFYADMIPVFTPFNMPVLIGGAGGYAFNKIDTVYDPAYTNVVYTADLLNPALADPSTLPAKIAAITGLRDAHNVPVFVQQVGIQSVNDPDHSKLAGGLAALNAAGVGYTIWTYRGKTAPDDYSMYYVDSGGNQVLKTAHYNTAVAGLKG